MLYIEQADTQGTLIDLTVENTLGACQDAVIMTIIVILLFLGDTDAAFMTALSLPFTYLLTFAVLKGTGYEFGTEWVTPHELIARLVTHIPDLWEQTTRYFTLYSNITRGVRKKKQLEGGDRKNAGRMREARAPTYWKRKRDQVKKEHAGSSKLTEEMGRASAACVLR